MAAAWMMLYWHSLQDLIGRWNNDDYSYCWFVPLLTLYLIYQKRQLIHKDAGGKVLPGYLLLAGTAAFFLVGRLASLETFTYLSMWLSLAGAAVLLLGSRSSKALRFPLFVLLFAIPAPPFITQAITFKLRLFSSTISVEALHWLGISAFREGNVIDLGTMQLQVVDACSGLRYLLPTLLIAIIVGYLFNARAWHRIVLVLLSVPVSILVNSLRIVVLALLVKHVSASLAEEGLFHDFSGWFIFIVTVGLLVCVSILFQRFNGATDKGRSLLPAPQAGERQEDEKMPKAPSPSWVHGATAGMILLGLFFLQTHVVTGQANPSRKSFSDFPFHMADWQGQRGYLSKEILNALWADDYVTGTFINRTTGNQLWLLVSFYEYQTTQHTAHAPTSCLLGEGWSIKHKQELPIDGSTERTFPVQQMVLQKGAQQLLANFWFQQRGRVITSEYMNKGYLFWDGLTRNRTDGALVRVEMAVAPGQSIRDAQLLLDGYTTELKNILTSHIPD